MPDKTAVTDIVRAALYARVSTDDQATRGTIEAQINALRQTELIGAWR